jgi:hypothetical protein
MCYIAAVAGHKEALADLLALMASTSLADREEWDQAEHFAQANHRANVQVMDIYDSTMRLCELLTLRVQCTTLTCSHSSGEVGTSAGNG